MRSREVAKRWSSCESLRLVLRQGQVVGTGCPRVHHSVSLTQCARGKGEKRRGEEGGEGDGMSSVSNSKLIGLHFLHQIKALNTIKRMEEEIVNSCQMRRILLTQERACNIDCVLTSCNEGHT